MSTLMLSACWKLQGLGPTEKLVLISMADQANDDGVCWPGVGSIARRTCLSERSVQRAITYLEERKLLYRVPRPGTSTVYRLTPPEAGGDTVAPRQSVTPGVSQSHPGGDTPSPGGCHSGTLTIIEPSLNRQRTTAAPSAPPWVPADTWIDFVAMRKKKRAPLTAKAIALIFARLEKLQAAGDDPRAVLEQSILNSWSNVFALKGDSHAGKDQPAKHQAGRDLSRAFLAEHG